MCIRDRLIDIGQCGDRLTADLLGSGVLRSHPSLGCSRHCVGRCQRVELQHFRQSKIEEFHRAIGCYKNVRGFEVAMDDEVAMCVLRRVEYREKKSETLAQSQLVVLAIAIDCLTFDVFHDEVWNTFRSHPSIQQPCNVGMIQSREDLPFTSKSFEVSRGVH